MKELNKLIFSDTPVSWRNLKAAQPFDFKFLGNIDITSILKNLSTFTEEQWNQHTTKNPNYKSVSSILWVKNDLKTGTDTDLINWKFITIEEDKLVGLFNSLKTNLSLDSNAGTPYVFIIDRDSNLRGRDDDDGVKYGYDSRSVADINNNMLDDVKVILAEYRMALKKNNRYKESLD